METRKLAELIPGLLISSFIKLDEFNLFVRTNYGPIYFHSNYKGTIDELYTFVLSDISYIENPVTLWSSISTVSKKDYVYANSLMLTTKDKSIVLFLDKPDKSHIRVEQSIDTYQLKSDELEGKPKRYYPSPSNNTSIEAHFYIVKSIFNQERIKHEQSQQGSH